MPPDHNQQHSRRPHYHRGRRGPDRRSGDRRPQQSQQQQPEQTGRDQLDIEQIMREIRSRISERHGIDLTSQQVQELAARRLEAILDPRTIKPSLMDELRRASGLPADTTPADPESAETIDESALYESDNGFLRGLRRLFNPILKLFFNPAAIVDALNAQTRRAKEAAARESELRRRQTEWNALHFEILRRLVTDVARVEIDNQHLAHRVESLTARVDFNERRVRGLEQSQHQSQSQPQSRPSARPVEVPAMSSAAAPAPPREDAPSSDHVSSSEASPDAGRRRRRRRRGRRSGQPREFGPGASVPGVAAAAAVDQAAEGDDFGDDDAASDDFNDDVSGAPESSSEQSTAPPSFDAPSFEPPAPVPDEPAPSHEEEPVQVVSSPVEDVPPGPEPSPVSPIEPVERSDRLPPEQS
jgi:hypothetical protein